MPSSPPRPPSDLPLPTRRSADLYPAAGPRTVMQAVWDTEKASLDTVVVFLIPDRKSTRLNSSHLGLSYALFPSTTPFRSPSPYTTLRRSLSGGRPPDGDAGGLGYRKGVPRHGCRLSHSRSEEHTSELQSLRPLVCPLPLHDPLPISLSLHDAPPISIRRPAPGR